jgi:uncharacterized protein
MTAATVFAEILIAGIAACGWIALALVALVPRLGVGVPAALTWATTSSAGRDALKAWGALFGPVLPIILLAAAYALGVLVDRLADILSKGYDQRLRQGALRKATRPADCYPALPKMRLHILAKQPDVGKSLDYGQSRLRIARSTMLNAPLLVLTGGLVAERTGIGGLSGTIVLILAGVVAVAIAWLFVLAWKDLARSHYSRVVEAYDLTREEGPNEAMIRSAYAAFAGGKLDGYWRACADDWVFRVRGCSAIAGDYEGKDGLARLARRREALAGGTFRQEVQDVLANDEHGVVLATCHLERDGRKRAYRTAHVYRIRGGRLAEGREQPEDQRAFDGAWSEARPPGGSGPGGSRAR